MQVDISTVLDGRLGL